MIQTVGDCILNFLPSMAVPRSAWGAALALRVFVTCSQCFSPKKKKAELRMMGVEWWGRGSRELCRAQMLPEHLHGGDGTSGGRRREEVKLKSWQSVATTTSLCSRDLPEQ